MKFNPGDPVWARQTTIGLDPKFIRSGSAYPGEHPGVVRETLPLIGLYVVEILDCASISPSGFWVIREHYLRPRRDDYQQHEPRTTMRDVREALKDNLLLKETVDES